MKAFKNGLLIAVMIFASFSCNKYVDIVPDNIATIDYAFRMRNTAEKYLFTCYAFAPLYNSFDMGFINVGDELLRPLFPEGGNGYAILRGSQNANNPYLNYWDGLNGGQVMFRAIRECNIFLENITKVPDMMPYEKEQWIAEAKFLKAYYHFFLMTLYGPIPVIKENLPVSAPAEQVRVTRRPVDEVVSYITQLIDEASPHLPLVVRNPVTDLGRVTLPVALAMKAKVLVYAASPLFNGNTDYAGFTNKDGTALFNTTYSSEKWVNAAKACKAAIDTCHAAGMQLYYFTENNQARNLSEQTKTQLNIRNSLTERWNSEIIWANTASRSAALQSQSTPRKIDPKAFLNGAASGTIGVPFNITNLFYTKNGVPINEDITWNYNGRFNLRTATAADKYHIYEGYQTAEYNFDRESRFYADLGFDGSIWYGLGYYDDKNSLYVQMKQGQMHGKEVPSLHAVTGYYPKKYVNYQSVLTPNGSTFNLQDYPWPIMRLADLYLLYAEALNESQGSVEEVFTYVDLVRKRAGLKGIKESWSNFSRYPAKFNTKEGLREIIHRERNVELALEGQRYFDLKRWKEALLEFNKPISGWDMDQSIPLYYYREKIIFRPSFSLKDYFWPIRDYNLIVNKNLVQNPGW